MTTEALPGMQEPQLCVSEMKVAACRKLKQDDLKYQLQRDPDY